MDDKEVTEFIDVEDQQAALPQQGDMVEEHDIQDEALVSESAVNEPVPNPDFDGPNTEPPLPTDSADNNYRECAHKGEEMAIRRMSGSIDMNKYYCQLVQRPLVAKRRPIHPTTPHQGRIALVFGLLGAVIALALGFLRHPPLPSYYTSILLSKDKDVKEIRLLTQDWQSPRDVTIFFDDNGQLKSSDMSTKIDGQSCLLTRIPLADTHVKKKMALLQEAEVGASFMVEEIGTGHPWWVVCEWWIAGPSSILRHCHLHLEEPVCKPTSFSGVVDEVTSNGFNLDRESMLNKIRRGWYHTKRLIRVSYNRALFTVQQLYNSSEPLALYGRVRKATFSTSAGALVKIGNVTTRFGNYMNVAYQRWLKH